MKLAVVSPRATFPNSSFLTYLNTDAQAKRQCRIKEADGLHNGGTKRKPG
jgi:hypothetical protein